MKSEITVEILRKSTSFNYKNNPNAPSSFDNNWNHNSEDTITIVKNDCELFACKCQSVANYCWGDYKSNGATECGDTVVGDFQIKCFVDPRSFHGLIHGIINAHDMDHQPIDEYSMQIVDGYQTGRWLIHDRYSFKTGKDTSYAWSAGCIILSSDDLAKFNQVLLDNGISQGDVIDAKVIDIDCDMM